MNTPMLHEMFMEKVAPLNVNAPMAKIKNGIVFADPTSLIDCTPEASLDNFRHLANGDAIVYCELANSTPFEGHSVEKKHAPLVQMRARTCCVFSDTDIRRMRNGIVGTEIVSVVGYPQGFLPVSDNCNSIGEVADASVMKCDFNGDGYLALCILCWMDRGTILETVNGNDGILYLSFCMSISKETCCRCGRTSTRGVPCRHVKNGTPNSALSICEFSKFTSLQLED